MGTFDEAIKGAQEQQGVEAARQARANQQALLFDQFRAMEREFVVKELPALLKEFVAAHIELGHRPVRIGSASKGLFGITNYQQHTDSVYYAGAWYWGSDSCIDPSYTRTGVDARLQLWDGILPPYHGEPFHRGTKMSALEWAAKFPLDATRELVDQDRDTVCAALRSHYVNHLAKSVVSSL